MCKAISNMRVIMCKQIIILVYFCRFDECLTENKPYYINEDVYTCMYKRFVTNAHDFPVKRYQTTQRRLSYF